MAWQARAEVVEPASHAGSEERGVEDRVRGRDEGPDAVVALVDRLAGLDGGAQRGDRLGRIGLAGVGLEGGELAIGRPP